MSDEVNLYIFFNQLTSCKPKVMENFCNGSATLQLILQLFKPLT